MFELRGRVALVTGAGRGVGVGVAQALARQGAVVAVNDLRLDRAQRTVEAIADSKAGKALAVDFDVTDYEATATAVESITVPGRKDRHRREQCGHPARRDSSYLIRGQ